MPPTLQGIGLAIGDEVAVVAGRSPRRGEWQRSEPAVVAPPSDARRVEVLLAGREALAAGVDPLLDKPRRYGYVTGEAAVATQLFAALLGTLRQQVPPDLLAEPSYPVVLARPHTVPAAVTDVLVEAAAAAGWGRVEVVSELTALAANAASGGLRQVRCAAGEWVHEARFEDGDGLLCLSALQSVRAQAGRGDLAPAETVAMGAARLAGPVGRPRAVLDPRLPLRIGMVAGQGRVMFLAPALRPGQFIRALRPPPAQGTRLRLVAGCQEEAPACQLLADLFLPAPRGRSDAPWLLSLAVGPDLSGSVSVTAPGLGEVAARPFRIHLP